jgi:hypothetical protein
MRSPAPCAGIWCMNIALIGVTRCLMFWDAAAAGTWVSGGAAFVWVSVRRRLRVSLGVLQRIAGEDYDILLAIHIYLLASTVRRYYDCFP